jgi:ubiquinone/menaquinone biosynthesis C-methylase UbiE
MQVLDCGCGPGSLTIDLAEHVAPGNVIGIDVEAVSLNRARDLAQSRGISNVRFEQADVYALPSEMSAWAERPDAFLSAMKCGALGWAPEA